MYAVNARARFECPCVLVVATPDSGTARWAAKPIDLGAGQLWAPLVVGPEGIPVIVDAGQAERDPELAVLSLMAHGKGDTEIAVCIALAATASLGHLSEEQRVLYLALIESALGDAARKAFEMHPQTEELMSTWQRGSFDKGRAETGAAAVLDVLDARGLSVTNEQRERIVSCSDLEQLKTWLRRAATARGADELFAWSSLALVLLNAPAVLLAAHVEIAEHEESDERQHEEPLNPTPPRGVALLNTPVDEGACDRNYGETCTPIVSMPKAPSHIRRAEHRRDTQPDPAG